jgi:Protein of unknown function C-terminus (DUF2399)./Protein of unknown function N-terminus (DUF3323).
MRTGAAEVDRLRRAAQYFGRPAFRRMLAAVWRKYESLGRIGGKAVVPDLSPDESEAIGAFFGWNLRPGGTAEIPLALFEAELRDSAFAIGLQELHQVLEGKPLLPKSERRQIVDAAWRRFLREARDSAGRELSAAAAGWLSRLEQAQGAGLPALRELYKTDPEQALSSLLVVVRALNFLFAGTERVAERPVRLPVLAVRVSGDAHALDIDRPAGRMLLAALRELSDMEDGIAAPGGDEAVWREGSGASREDEDGSGTLKLRELYRRFGILDDDLSSIVHWYVPVPYEPAMPRVWTLRQVEAAERVPRCSAIFVVENPAVFSTIVDAAGPGEAGDEAPALVCTSGPASAAAIRWMQRTLESSGEGCKLFYSGDFDVKGLSMARTLAGLFPTRFVPWRFDSKTYLEATGSLPGPAFDDSELARLENMEAEWDPSLCAVMRETGRKLHQEAFVEVLVRDFRNAGGCG